MILTYLQMALAILSGAGVGFSLGLIGGGGSIASYGLALWAMTKAPVASVAALRETAILFALFISVVFLKEKASIWRYIAGAMIAAGVLALKLG